MMPVKKFRSIEQMSDTWYAPGDPRLPRAIASTWALADQLCPLHFPPGVYKHRTIEEADGLREQWDRANFEAQQRRLGKLR